MLSAHVLGHVAILGFTAFAVASGDSKFHPAWSLLLLFVDGALLAQIVCVEPARLAYRGGVSAFFF